MISSWWVDVEKFFCCMNLVVVVVVHPWSFVLTVYCMQFPQDQAVPHFLSSRFIQPTADSLFSYGYVFREVEEELLTRYEKEGPVVPEHVTWESLCEYLGLYFASSVVQTIYLNFLDMKDSGLGQEYFLRGGVSMLGLRALHDVTDEFAEFYSSYVGGPAQVQDQEWTVVTRSRSQHNQSIRGSGSEGQGGSSSRAQGGPSSRAQGGPSSRGGRRGGGRRGGGRRGGGRRGGGRRGGGRRGGGGGGNSGEDIAFLEVSVVEIALPEIALPAFSTPDKHTLPPSVVRQTIGERSNLYSTKVQEYLHKTTGVGLYAPELVESGSVFLFHGMRESSWSSFRRFGIRPKVVPNEFSTDGAFYLTNSLRHAFEHPLHQHPRRNTTDFISILVFVVPVLVLHGEIDAPGGSDPFRIKWFVHADAEWREFCHNNLVVRRLPHHSYDLVIGPSCLPASVGGVSTLRIDGFAPTQIACCTDRAQEWIASTASTIYVEKRQLGTCN